MAPFKYPRLYSGNESFRLIKLYKQASNAKASGISCDLELAYLGGGRRYDAISYVWGHDSRTRKIKVGGLDFAVSVVVYEILLRLRGEADGRDRLIWLDLLSIDQDDALEKGQQVQRMKQIFAEAETVIASIDINGQACGEACCIDLHLDGSICRLMRQFTSDIVRVANIVDRGQLRSEGVGAEKDEAALMRLLDHPWFHRVWVIQEATVARKVVLMCATDLEDSTLIDAAQLAKICMSTGRQPAVAKLRATLDNLLPFLSHIAEGSDRPHAELLSLLQSFRSWKATDPRDKVYALLGISSDGPEAKQLGPDYGLSVEALYQRVAVYMIDRYQSLDILSLVLPIVIDHDERRRNSFPELMRRFRPPKAQGLRLPSWCPDWRVVAAGTTAIAVGSSRPVAEPVQSLSMPDNDNILSVRGARIGIIGSMFPNGVDVKLERPSDKDIPGKVLTALSRQLAHISSDFAATVGIAMVAGDLICILEHTTGITVLRPAHGRYSVLLCRHGQYSQVVEAPEGSLLFEATADCDDFGRLMRDLYIGKYQRRPSSTSSPIMCFGIV